jgi:hypothetical protein
MRRILFLACSAVALAASAATTGEVAPAAKLSAEQIVARNVAARGGLAAWRAVQTLTMSGQLDSGGKENLQLPFVMQMKRPHRSRLEIRFKGQTAVQVYDGTDGWKVRPFLGRDEVEPYTPAQAKEAASWAELDGPLIDYAAKGSRVELQGAEAVEGRNAYKLKLTMKDGAERNVWVDAANFLEVKIDGASRKMDGRVRKVSIYYRDYRTENGLTMPRALETVVEGFKPGRKMKIERVALNQPLEDALFSRPQLPVAAVSGR